MTTKTPDALAPLTGNEITAEDAAESAEAHRQAAGEAAGLADDGTAEAERIMTEARERAAVIMAAAEDAARVLAKSADQARRQAGALEERTRFLGAATAGLTAEAGAEARADALEAEREQLAADVTELDGKLGGLAAERGQLDAQMTEARESGDLDALAALRSRDSAAAEVAASLTAQRGAGLARFAEIGDGTETFGTHPLLTKLPPLSKAREDAEHARRSVRDALNMAFPERPEAVVDRAKAERAERERYRARSWEAEQARQRAMEPRTFVRL